MDLAVDSGDISTRCPCRYAAADPVRVTVPDRRRLGSSEMGSQVLGARVVEVLHGSLQGGDGRVFCSNRPEVDVGLTLSLGRAANSGPPSSRARGRHFSNTQISISQIENTKLVHIDTTRNSPASRRFELQKRSALSHEYHCPWPCLACFFVV